MRMRSDFPEIFDIKNSYIQQREPKAKTLLEKIYAMCGGNFTPFPEKKEKMKI